MTLGPVNGTGGIATVVQAVRQGWTASDIDVVFVDNSKAPEQRGRPIVAVKVVTRVLRKLMLESPDILHIHHSSYRSYWEKMPLVGAARLLDVPVVLHSHGGEFKKFYRCQSRIGRCLIRRTFQASARVVVLGEAWSRFFRDEIGVSREKLAVVGNAVPQKLFDDLVAIERPRLGADDTVRIFFLANIEPRKGLLDLIEALGDLSVKLPWELSVGGQFVEADYGALVRENVARRGIEDRIEWLGDVRGKSKLAAFAAADVFVLPSHVEGLPLTLLEAMAAGLPIVASNVGSVAEAVEDGVEALLFPAGNATRLRAQLRRLITDRDLRVRMGRSASDRAYLDHSAATMCRRLEAVYRQAVRNDG